MGLKVWSSWGPGGRKPKSHYYGGFFFIILKVDLEISPLLERPFCEKLSIFISI